MKLSPEHQNFALYLAKYLGIALISGSVVHIGTLAEGTLRYAILMITGLILMTYGNITEARKKGETVHLSYFFTITILSLTTGFMSGGIQHYLDNPTYAGTLLGIGCIGAYLTYFSKEKIKITARQVLVITCIGIGIIALSRYIIADTFAVSYTHLTLPTNREV